VKSWVVLATTFVCVFLARWVGRLPMAVFAGVAAGGCLLAAGSLRATVFVLKRAAGLEGFRPSIGARAGPNDDEEPGRPDRSAPGGAREVAEDASLRRMTEAIAKMPERASLALELALYWAGAALAFVAFTPHAAAAGWAGASAGLLASSGSRSRCSGEVASKVELAAFALASAAAGALSLFWVAPGPELQLARTGAAALTMSAGAAATGASILAMRWRFSERLSLPPAMALAVWSLTWFFARGEELGHSATIVAWGVALGAAMAAAGYLSRSLDGAASGVTLFLASRVHAFLDWPASVAFFAGTALGWRPRAARGAAHELAAGALPLALAAGYFTFRETEFMSAYLAACCAATADALAGALQGRARARVAVVAGTTAAFSFLPALSGRYPDCGVLAALSALAGALLAWSAGELLLARLPGWLGLPGPIRRAALGAASAAIAAAISAVGAGA